jgi:hypothetical protein
VEEQEQKMSKKTKKKKKLHKIPQTPSPSPRLQPTYFAKAAELLCGLLGRYEGHLAVAFGEGDEDVKRLKQLAADLAPHIAAAEWVDSTGGATSPELIMTAAAAAGGGGEDEDNWDRDEPKLISGCSVPAGGQLVCARCHNARYKTSYSASQQKKKISAVCKECVATKSG